jgi:hypothetical protein
MIPKFARPDKTTLSSNENNPKQAKALSPRLQQYLLTSATVIGAGLASSAQAEIVYTPLHDNFKLDYYLDLNHDGINDFHLHSYYISQFGSLNVTPLITGNRIAATQEFCSFRLPAAAPLRAGAVIGKNSKFPDGNTKCLAGFNSTFQSFGPWVDAKDAYLGVVFEIQGQEHFGWVRITFNSFFCYKCIAGITGYAYETVPGRAILAGDTGQHTSELKEQTLGVLAMGAPGLDLWRKNEE